MNSRLDRLFILLDTGSNESIRLAAAKQLGEVQRIQPNELNYLLMRIKEYSSKSVWETRTAAGQATRCVLEQVGPWPPNSSQPASDEEKRQCRREIAEKLIEQHVKIEQIFQQFDLDRIMSTCPKLLSLDVSETDELEQMRSASSKGTVSRGRNRGRTDPALRSLERKNVKEQLLRQRKLINKELGIAMVDSLNLGVKSTDIVSNDDLQTEYDSRDPSNLNTKSSNLLDGRDMVQQSVNNYDKILTVLHQSNCISKPSDNEELTRDSSQSSHSCFQWPLTTITKQYTDDLFNPSWEIRHGAAIALREIVRLQGKYAGRRSDLSERANDILNQVWLIDMALKALSVLALDKFGDFLFDQVVAPVRENASQYLGCCLAHMSEENTCSIIDIILKMLLNTNWETRHGGILGLKYYLNVINESFSKRILQNCFEPIFRCLGDSNDDVSAEAAASLVPVKDLMMKVIPEKAPKLIRFLWDHLAYLDELTTSTSNIVLLLASLITSSSAKLDSVELVRSIPKLWPLLSHSSTSVRISTLKALITLIKSQESTCLSWMPEELMSTALKLVYQRSILENMDDARMYIEEVWMLLIQIEKNSPKTPLERLDLLKSTSQCLNFWLCLIMQPSNTPLNRNPPMWANIKADGRFSDTKPDGDVYIGSCTFNAETINQQKLQVTKCRLLATRLIGALYANLVDNSCEVSDSQHPKETLKYLADMFIHYSRTKSANQRIISGWALESWANHQIKLFDLDSERLKSLLPKILVDQLNLIIQETNLCYDELASTFTRLQLETRNFVASLGEANIDSSSIAPTDKRAIYTLNQIQSLCDIDLEKELNKTLKKRACVSSINAKLEQNDVIRSETYTLLYNKKANLTKSLKITHSSQKTLSTSVLSSLSCALISWLNVPEQMKLIVEPLLDSIKFEEEQALQDKSISYLVILFDVLTKDSDKHKELLNYIFTQLIEVSSCRALTSISDEENATNSLNSPRCSIDLIKRNGIDIHRIVLLDNLQRRANLSRSISRRQSSINSTSSLKRSHSLTSSLDLENDAIAVQEESSRTQNDAFSESRDNIKVRGASSALSNLAKHFAVDLPQKLPLFWETITTAIKSEVAIFKESDIDVNEIKLLKSLILLSIVGDSLHVDLRDHLLDLYPNLILLLTSSNSMIRHHSSQCIGIISKLMLDKTIGMISKNILPMLEQSDNTLARCGSIESIALIIEHLQLDLVSRINMFIIHVLRRMSDQNDQIRLMATHCFGKLLSLMPLNLEESKDVNDKDSESLLENVREDNERFIEQLLDQKKLDNFIIPFEMKAELRTYQQEGLNWLAFLNRFNLHGILCDEMGLGKTFMTICMVASDHFKVKNERERVCSNSPSLIVCPSTLTEHWLYEISKFLPSNLQTILNPVAYTGALSDRLNLRTRILNSINNSKDESTNKSCERKPSDEQAINLVVVSYDIVRNDLDFFREVYWNYCVLDEGHIIKNGKTKLSRAIRLITAKHRLILSGTPIQNNVTELWSLFDFLMPGFLGSDRQFIVRYAKPILQSREPKCSARELEAGALAMESLHRQVLPFILRRLKEDVLDDLPPKIIQDYYCELSPLQHKLYEDFTRSSLCKDVTKKSLHRLHDEADESTFESKSNSKSHVFQALQYLKNVCNHPKLVLTDKHSQYTEIKKSLSSEKSCLDDITHSSKLKALKQLLIDCGIGVISQSGDDQQQQQSIALETVVNQHRALIFCQIRSMAEIIENDLFKKHLPSITYLKLDGSIAPNQRHSIVSRFNNDPSIDILLLTTQIGGLGLNLTGADTVIFVEHDWNPTKDLQAMDRAHRIGQKKVVNVYRLITKGTLEEKIMGLQKFKTMVSNTVINQDNAGLRTMNVDQLFDLFEDSASDKGYADSASKQMDGANKSKSSFIDLLPELWDQQQYETEYDLSTFVSSLKN